MGVVGSAARRPSWLVMAVAVPVGLAGGALTSYGQTVLTDGWAALANSGAPWVMVAFAIGLFVPGRWPSAAVAGLLSQVGLVLGYYATTDLRGFAVGMGAIVIWSVTGAVAGPVYGAAGALLRYGVPGHAETGPTPPDRRAALVRSLAAGVPGSVWLMEGLHFFWLAGDRNSNSGPGVVAGWAYVVVGIGLPLLLARSGRERLYALAALVVAAGLVLVALVVIDGSFYLV